MEGAGGGGLYISTPLSHKFGFGKKITFLKKNFPWGPRLPSPLERMFKKHNKCSKNISSNVLKISGFTLLDNFQAELLAVAMDFAFKENVW